MTRTLAMTLLLVAACAAPVTVAEPAPGELREEDESAVAADPGETDGEEKISVTGTRITRDSAEASGAPPPAPVAEAYDESPAEDLGGLERSRGGAAKKKGKPSSTASRGSYRPSAPALKAGRHDDNAQYNRFLQFMRDNQSLSPYPVDVNERLVVRATDSNGKSLHDCTIEIKNLKGELRSTSRTYADGTTQFFPSAMASPGESEFTVRASCAGKVRNGQLRRDGKRETVLTFPSSRKVPRRVPVDVAVVLDTTGSMSAQINRLKSTLQAIHVQLTALPSNPDIRFALVAYRDRTDDYVTQLTGFTDDVRFFQTVLDKLDADGGGDTPEDLQSGLKDAMKKLSWRPGAVRVGFIVADAVPHTDYGQQYTYRSAMQEALERGIKWVSVGAGGLPRQGEVIFRQIAQYTMGEYVFVTGSGGGDTDGSRTEASHNVGTNYKMENLDQAMVRIVRRELSYLTDNPRDFDTTIVATAKEKLSRDIVLAPAVKEALRQLLDYSSIRLNAGTPVAVAPFTVS
ncbi:MAG: vWA domain-containing protein, partial [Myxococcota bacterium]